MGILPQYSYIHQFDLFLLMISLQQLKSMISYYISYRFKAISFALHQIISWTSRDRTILLTLLNKSTNDDNMMVFYPL